jgi:hypothetical protein
VNNGLLMKDQLRVEEGCLFRLKPVCVASIRAGSGTLHYVGFTLIRRHFPLLTSSAPSVFLKSNSTTYKT